MVHRCFELFLPSKVSRQFLSLGHFLDHWWHFNDMFLNCFGALLLATCDCFFEGSHFFSFQQQRFLLLFLNRFLVGSEYPIDLISFVKYLHFTLSNFVLLNDHLGFQILFHLQFVGLLFLDSLLFKVLLSLLFEIIYVGPECVSFF